MANHRGSKEKRAVYMKEYLRNQPQEKKERKKAIMRARSRALTRLSIQHHVDFYTILDEEMEKEGL